MRLIGNQALDIASAYRNLGYAIAIDDNRVLITCKSRTVSEQPPMFVHAYVQKALGIFPNLKLAVSFDGGVRFSQLCITYMMSYVLGMLVRYYPTHWIALINGSKGDLLRPTINRAQQHVENAFPELVAEYVTFAMDNQAWVAKHPVNECPTERDVNRNHAADMARSCPEDEVGSRRGRAGTEKAAPLSR